MKIMLRYLTADRAEESECVDVYNVEELATRGVEIVRAYGEYSEEEIDQMEPEDLASLALSDEKGHEAYSLFCAGMVI